MNRMECVKCQGGECVGGFGCIQSKAVAMPRGDEYVTVHRLGQEEPERYPVQREKAQRKPTDAAEILGRMGDTFRERQKTYGSNYKMVAPLVKVLFPDGVPSELVTTHRWHLFELKLVKLSRFAISGLTHADSIHDDAVYSAMIEAILLNGEDE